MNLKIKLAALCIVAATSAFATSVGVDGLIDELNKTTDDVKKIELMKKIDENLAKMSKEEREKAVAKIKVEDLKTPNLQKPSQKVKSKG